MPAPTVEQIETWKREALQKLVKTIRKEKSVLPITVGTQIVSTRREEDGEWIARKMHAISAEALPRYPYTPDGGKPVMLTTGQVLRIEACRTWYVNACFAAEEALTKRIDSGMPFTAFLVHMQDVWPQTQFDG
jgi:imidazoleglycerol phosphate synthase glutamine amidotransferase subunit HisH